MRSFYLVLFLVISGTAWGQSDSLPEYRPAQIPVISALRLPSTAFGTPIAASVLDSNALTRARAGMSLYEPLTLLPGLFAQNPDNFAQDLRLSVRGFGARAAFGIRGVRLLVDGIPESTPDGQGEVDNIDPLALERVELIRTPSAGLYGNAAGGVLAFQTRTAAPGWHAQALAGMGAFGQQRYLLGSSWGGKKWSHVATFSHTQQKGYREHSSMAAEQLNLKSVFEPDSNTRLTLVFSGVTSPFADDPGGLTALQVTENRQQARPQALAFNTGEAVRQAKLAAVFQQKLLHWQWGARFFGAGRTLDNLLPFNIGGAVSLRRAFGGTGVWVGYQTSWRPSFTLHLQSGLDAEQQEDHRRRYNNEAGLRGAEVLNQIESFRNLAWWNTCKLQYQKRWTALLSLRVDDIRVQATDQFLSNGDQSGTRRFGQWSPMAGLDYALTSQHHLYANWSAAFETPSLSELSANPDAPGGFADLQAQKSRSVELGWKAAPRPRLQWELTVFAIQLRDELVPYQLAEQAGRTFFRNAGQSQRIGLEAQAGWQFLPQWTAYGVYNGSDFRYHNYIANGSDLSGNRQPGIPVHTGSMECRYKTPRFFATLQLRRTSKIWADDANLTQQEGWTWAGVRMGYPLNMRHFKFEPYLGIQNIGNAGYNANLQINAAGNRYFEPASGRYLYLGCHASF
ncbi:MAG: TonB-dependent receptor [Lewinellaceae bacterium]|nr:TonB-dependent receptor [Lewinellaceae bacterium]